MGQSEIQRRYTAEEYFALEVQSEVRHEYFDGEIFAMAGGTKSHNLITQNMTLALRAGLRGKGCQVFMEMSGWPCRTPFTTPTPVWW